MGTEVLRPQDCLIRSSPALRNPSHQPKNFRRKREGSPKRLPRPRQAMEQVTILRRGPVAILRQGETPMAAKARRGDTCPVVVPSSTGGDDFRLDSALFGVGRLGPDPALIPKEIRLKPPAAAEAQVQGVLYAGTAFDLSPSPRALPLPSFSNRKEEPAETARAVVDCSARTATMDLRRLLRLD